MWFKMDFTIEPCKNHLQNEQNLSGEWRGPRSDVRYYTFQSEGESFRNSDFKRDSLWLGVFHHGFHCLCIILFLVCFSKRCTICVFCFVFSRIDSYVSCPCFVVVFFKMDCNVSHPIFRSPLRMDLLLF